MRAAVVEQFQEPLVIRDVPDPTPPHDGAVIRVEANGVCRSDWHFWSGDWPDRELPRILGHEFTGVVEAVGPAARGFKPGDRVLAPFSPGDGTCRYCAAGFSNLCENQHRPGLNADGAYAQYVAIPNAIHGLVHLPEEITFRDGASLGCRFMTAFRAVVDQAAVRPGEWVAVFGCGGVGLSAVHIASMAGARVIGVDIDPDKLRFAQGLGAAFVLNSKETDPSQAIQELTGGGAHVALDALGIAETCRAAIRSLRKRGRHVQVGLTTKLEGGLVDVPIDHIVRNELQLTGSFGMQTDRLPLLLDLVACGRLRPGSLVTREISIYDVSDVLQDMTTYKGTGVQVITSWEREIDA